MGLDAVEIVLRTEELFVITIEDGEVAIVRTVGNFYDLVCGKLNLVPLQAPVSSAQLPEVTMKKKTFLFMYKHTPLPAPAEVLPWSSQSVWDCRVAVIVDQQGLKPDKVQYDARFVEDLGVD
jgi:acyl carrier protein